MVMIKAKLILFLVVFSLLFLVACGGAENEVPAATPTTATATTAANSAQELPLANEALSTVTQVAAAAGWTPVDATPDPAGEVVYFTVRGATVGVFKVRPGGEAAAVATGAPFVSPVGLAISTDGQTLYVAENGAAGNGIYTVSVNGSAPALLTDTAGTSPRVPEIVNENGQDQLYYSGTAEGQPAVFKVAAAGGEPAVVFRGAPLVNPSGVAIAGDGTVYVVDPADGVGAVYRIRGGTAEAIASNVTADPDIAGATLTLDGSALLVSHLHPQEKTAQVLIINLATLEQAIFNKGIVGNPGAGGVHRAHLTGDLAWSDYRRAGGGGGVYFLEP